MGRAHEVRAASMAKTAAKKSAANGRAAKEIYMAAKQGGTDPNSNLVLRSVIDKAKANQIPRDVIERAIKRAAGGDAENYVSNRYEGIGPSNVAILVDTLTSNVNRAAAMIREVFNKNKGNPDGKVSFLFEDVAMFAFKNKKEDEVLEALMSDEVEINDLICEDDTIIIYAPFKAYNSVKHSLDKLNIDEYLISEIRAIPIDKRIEIKDEQAKLQLQTLLDKLDELEDVQNVYHNAEL
ncbi:YebC/PmpR family DNA-binding transcriptional regulator [Mycoplasma mycoides]|uniref:YebC/PmpR family DNA-binding transcriptional regulator n=1 Tax=Mycoplasma mycoides TaxID=2102 RepID=UPI002737402F|nr:YebC/PmpR family DNA-binding transcriptional regulator [Mycoplasma mycoides]MDP4040216.1 YebC/PmpR family DNA-binding transcriptional regulator [Mycoplasma mycoides]MDP4041083.1 YebC/PmpR family DNA-binding transcriptional regulator [Mycoplasma mycoides]MDP4041972.1 YebC/PmpR family DNA-binding transcriptional regulator [Mycoplasma mycoides]MDP4043844.1 YebC/PmpR family DNA-binding transcriptional regulator [Mycoplasma mycoides]MDP4044751.1 YebC/PmpR family DNA-binding transcriptional regul